MRESDESGIVQTDPDNKSTIIRNFPVLQTGVKITVAMDGIFPLGKNEIFIKEETKKIKASWHIVPKEQGLEVSMEYDESHYKECKTSF